MKIGERDAPGCGAALLVVIATVGVVILRAVATCLSDATFGRPTLNGCVQQHTDAVVFGGGALALVLFIVGAVLIRRVRQSRTGVKVHAPVVSVVEFAEMWADDQERFERLAALDIRTQADAVIAEGASGARYAQAARALGITVPKDEPSETEETTPADVRGTRAFVAGILAVASAWIAWDPLSCAFTRSSLGRCLQDPARIDSLIFGLGLLVAGAIVALAAPPIWMRHQPGEGVPPWVWIADHWQRHLALGREPTGSDLLRRGARIAAAVSEYVQLARPVTNAPLLVTTGKEVGLEKENPLDLAAAFGEQMAQHADAGGYRIRSDHALPYPRKAIRAALYVMLTATRNEKRRVSVGPVLMDLAEYVSEEELAPFTEAVATADAFMRHTFSLAQRQLTPDELLAQAMRRPETERYDSTRLAPLEQLVSQRQQEEIAELERRYPEIVGTGSASKMWFMGSLERVVRAAERVEEQKRATALDPLFGDQRPEAVGMVVGVFASRELLTEIGAARKYEDAAHREQLEVYRGVLDRLEQALADQISGILMGDREKYASAEATFRTSIQLLRRMENASINVELRKAGVNVRMTETEPT